MYDLRKDYNRVYYRKIARITLEKHYKLFRVKLCKWVLYVCFWICPDVMEEITGARKIDQRRSDEFLATMARLWRQRMRDEEHQWELGG